jgi:hypothetical protein
LQWHPHGHILATPGLDGQKAVLYGSKMNPSLGQADPLVCKRCGGPLKVVVGITDGAAIRQILDHLGVTPPEKIGANPA